MRTSGLGVSVPVCASCVSSVSQGSSSTSASCFGVLDPRGLGGLSEVRSSRRSLLSECWGAGAGTSAEDVPGTCFSFFRDPTYPVSDFIVFRMVRCISSVTLFGGI